MPDHQDRDWLAAQLADGHSIEAIARATGRHPSTIAYWVKKHGLASDHAGAYRPRGPLQRSELEALIAEGCSVREIAERVDRGFSTVRHWLKRYGLATLRGASPAREAEAGDTALRRCPNHGVTLYRRNASEGRFRCLRCAVEDVNERRRATKRLLVAEAGGRCTLCGYDRHVGALQFHHVDPNTKRVTISGLGTRSIELARTEARRCVLLCANCHAEVEAGLATIHPPGRQT